MIQPTKLLQFFIAPWAFFIFLAMSVYFIFTNIVLLLLFAIVFAVSMLAMSRVLAAVKHPTVAGAKLSIIQTLVMAVLMNGLLIVGMLAYPFVQKTSKYARI